jgi:hypothetical protein
VANRAAFRGNEHRAFLPGGLPRRLRVPRIEVAEPG